MEELVEKVSRILDDNPGVKRALLKSLVIQAFTTRDLSILTDADDDAERARDGERRVQTNPEFRNFFQRIFHAGSPAQFRLYAELEDKSDLVRSTFNYLFHVFKKGVFVRIRDNRIRVFLPFSKHNYVNDWGRDLRTRDGDFTKVVAMAEAAHRDYSNDYAFQTMVLRDPRRWYANYNMFRNTVYRNGELRMLTDEGDKSVKNFLDILTELCYSRVVPDSDFFINPRDYPVVTRDMTHPYDRLYRVVPSLAHHRLCMRRVPVFSQSATDRHQDVLFPNDDDIVWTLDKAGRPSVERDWTKKKPVAVFRGSATGRGVTPGDNQRLRLVEIAKEHQPILDAKLTSLGSRIKVNADKIAVQIDKRRYPVMNREYKSRVFLSPQQQSLFKYIVHVEGNVAAFRLTKELSMGSLVIMVRSEYKTWYSDRLRRFRITDPEESAAGCHVVTSEVEDIAKTVSWCIAHDEVCRQIAAAGLEFYESALSNGDAMLDYLVEALGSLERA